MTREPLPEALEALLPKGRNATAATADERHACATHGTEVFADAGKLGRGWFIRRILVAADLAGLLLALSITELLLGKSDDWPEAVAFLITLPAWPLVASLYRLYDHDEQQMDYATIDEFASVFHLVTVGLWLLYTFGRLTRLFDPNVLKLVMFWALAILCLIGIRAIARTLARRSPRYLQRALIVGAGEVGQELAAKLIAHPEYRVHPIGFVDLDAPESMQKRLEHLKVVGEPDDLLSLVDRLSIDRVIFAFPQHPPAESLRLVRRLCDQNIHVDVVPRLYEVIGYRMSIQSVGGITLLGLPPLKLSRPLRLAKRLLDAGLAALGIFMLLPALGVFAIAIKLTSTGPVLFKQVRIGLGGKPFEIYKFRTMVDKAEDFKIQLAHLNVHARSGGDARMFKVPSDPRITAVGKILRTYSLDELPQLLNVVRGQMSLVGPRPLILDEDRHVIGWARRRLDLQPGMTGPWQALGASAIPFGEMIRLDYLYITNWSLFGDIKWIWRTVPAVLRTRST